MSDDLGDTIGYPEVYRLVKEIVDGQPKNVIESVVEEIAMNLIHGK